MHVFLNIFANIQVTANFRSLDKIRKKKLNAINRQNNKQINRCIKLIVTCCPILM